MIETSNLFAKTTGFSNEAGVFDDVLRSLRITGCLLLRDNYAAPWAVEVPDHQQLAKLLGLPVGVRAVAFHLLEFGHCEISYGDTNRVLLNAGDMAVCFGGEPHRIAAGNPVEPQEIANLIAGGLNTQRPDGARQTPATSLLCGVFLLRHVELNPLLADLPPVVHCTLGRRGTLHNLSGVARLLTEEIERGAQGSGFVIERMVEVLCAEAVRAHLEATPADGAGWFHAINDPVVGRALAAIHAAPGEKWSVQRLASRVSMSPSRLAARFAESLGASPMAYLASWRMNVACRKLACSDASIERIAAEVGYSSNAAFHRAFKKMLGQPPAAWRESQRE
ncbi:MAG: AraC family transcriptional regulator [Pseudomonadota bacterium]